MKKLLNVIESYGFLLEKLAIADQRYYLCVNEGSNKSFLLDVNWSNSETLTRFDQHEALGISKETYIFYLLEVKDNPDHIIHIYENFVDKKAFLLIYDQNEEFELFMKDLWNLVIQI